MKRISFLLVLSFSFFFACNFSPKEIISPSEKITNASNSSSYNCQLTEEKISNLSAGELHNLALFRYVRALKAHLVENQLSDAKSLSNQTKFSLFKSAIYSTLELSFLSAEEKAQFEAELYQKWESPLLSRTQILEESAFSDTSRTFLKSVLMSKSINESDSVLNAAKLSGEIQNEEYVVLESTASVLSFSNQYWAGSDTAIWNDVCGGSTTSMIPSNLEIIAYADAEGFIAGWNDAWGPYKPAVAIATASVYSATKAHELLQ